LPPVRGTPSNRVVIANAGSMRIEDGLIREIFIQVNPDKLPG
jgi:hypothetical protein